MKQSKLKALIELAFTAEEADCLIMANTTCSSPRDKFNFINEMFDFTIIGRTEEDIEADYWCALTAIVKDKWRK